MTTMSLSDPRQAGTEQEDRLPTSGRPRATGQISLSADPRGLERPDRTIDPPATAVETATGTDRAAAAGGPSAVSDRRPTETVAARPLPPTAPAAGAGRVAEPARMAPAAQPAPRAAGPSDPAASAGDDPLEQRLRATAEACVAAYHAWKTNPTEGASEGLHTAVHEARKALSRVEIELSASRRDEHAVRPIPIPAHRSARRGR